MVIFDERREASLLEGGGVLMQPLVHASYISLSAYFSGCRRIL
jgi:hypothetical protein